jgi:DUF2075 family protein
MTIARHGWVSPFERFRDSPLHTIRARLRDFITDASPEQIRAWDDSIPPLQREVAEVIDARQDAAAFSTILEYQLPLELRRPDVILLVNGGVLVLELKGKIAPSQADLDQAAAYARDLRCYHQECAHRVVVPILVPTRAVGYQGERGGVHVSGPDALDELVLRLTPGNEISAVSSDAFLNESAYRPLPTLVEAARELFRTGELRRIERAAAATQPAIDRIAAVIHDAARTKTRRLVLVTGVPGAGKTLVGLRTVHSHFLDDLAVDRGNGKPTAPAVFLSGNGPLVEVLQYELRGGGGDGKTFVRGVKEYVQRYSRSKLVPNEHVLVFDEAQRAFDSAQVDAKHRHTTAIPHGKSEPEHFVEFSCRIPEWSVVVGLIGSGQEIHVGEEAGLGEWRKAVEGVARSTEWVVYGPSVVRPIFDGSPVPFVADDVLSLDTELRFHLASDVHKFVTSLLDDEAPATANRLHASKLEEASFHLRITRSLKIAKEYLRERYGDDPEARFGLIASSKDRDLMSFDVPNDFQSTKRIRYGPWYSDPEDAPGRRSCRQLESCATEFGAQGLELDATLLAWGTDLMWTGRAWSTAAARGYLRKARVRNPRQLRLNAYRVLLTRGRDACVIFVPPMPELTETYEHLRESGYVVL